MAVFLTGGTGFLGQALVRALASRGKEVRALVRPDSDVRGLDLERIRTAFGDVRDADSVRHAMAGCRVVIHAAAHTARTGNRRDFEDTNVGGFRNVMDAAWHHKVKMVVAVSCFLAIGPTEGEIGDEDHFTAARRGASAFEESVRALEPLHRSYLSGGLPLVVVYPGLVYGPGPVNRPNLVSGLVVDRSKGTLFSVPFREDRRVSLAYVDDVAEGVVRALERGRSGDRFLLGGHNVPMLEVFRILEKASGLKAPRRARTSVGAGAKAKLAEWGAKLRGREPTACPFTLDLLQHDWAYSSAHAEERLGYRNRDLVDGVKSTLRHLVLKGRVS